jgi:hypothetical protein
MKQLAAKQAMLNCADVLPTAAAATLMLTQSIMHLT